MKRGKRILLAIGCIMLLGLSWLAAVTAKTDAQRQEELMAQAAAYVEAAISTSGPFRCWRRRQLTRMPIHWRRRRP